MQYVTCEKGYYLPLGYNDNKIVLLVRDPKWLFAYWEVSNDRKQDFIDKFGQDSWNNSRPVIKLINQTKGFTRIIEIKDYASKWYIEVEHPNCSYSAEIGRMLNNDFFVPLAESNAAKTPTNMPSDNRKPVMFSDYKDLNNAKEVNINVAVEVSIEVAIDVAIDVMETYKPNLGKYEHNFNNSLGDNLSSLSLPGVSSDIFIK